MSKPVRPQVGPRCQVQHVDKFQPRVPQISCPRFAPWGKGARGHLAKADTAKNLLHLDRFALENRRSVCNGRSDSRLGPLADTSCVLLDVCSSLSLSLSPLPLPLPLPLTALTGPLIRHSYPIPVPYLLNTLLSGPPMHAGSCTSPALPHPTKHWPDRPD